MLSNVDYLKNGDDFLVLVNNGLNGVQSSTQNADLASYFNTNIYDARISNSKWYFQKNDSLSNSGNVQLTFNLPSGFTQQGGNANTYYLVHLDSGKIKSFIDTLTTNSGTPSLLSSIIDVDSLIDKHIALVSSFRLTPLPTQKLELSVIEHNERTVYMRLRDLNYNASNKYQLLEKSGNNPFSFLKEAHILNNQGEIRYRFLSNKKDAYYKVAKLDLSEQSSFSNTVFLEGKEFLKILAIPAEKSCIIEIENNTDRIHAAHFSLVNLEGKVCSDLEVILKIGHNKYEINNLRPGIYVLNFTSDISMKSQKIFIK
jgi:hypothetical protein